MKTYYVDGEMFGIFEESVYEVQEDGSVDSVIAFCQCAVGSMCHWWNE